MGTFGTIANSSTSFGLKPAIPLSGLPGGRWTLGLYLGRDNFSNPSGGSGFHFTHFSPEIEFTPALRVCPIPSLHLGVGAYRNENGDTEMGYNVGGSAAICLTDRVSLLTRYDRRSVKDFDRDYSTLQVGVRFRF
jgi:hypothetical protein